MLLRIWTFARGYLVVKVIGFSPERFLNLCTNNNILIWDLRKDKEGYYFKISIKGFKLIKPFVKKTNTRIIILDKIGLPFFFYKYRKRKLFFLGIGIFILFVYILSLFIWAIEINGNSTYTDEMLLKYLSKNGYSTGIWKNKIKCSKIEKIILNDFSEVSWLSAEIQGTKLIINIKETLEHHSEVKENESCDIISDRNGIITSIITRNGTPQVVKGDVVTKGDILVSSEILIKMEQILKDIRLVHADADIYAKTVYKYNDELMLKYNKKEYTGKTKKGYVINLFDNRITIFHPRIKYDKYDKIETNNNLKIGKNFYLPIKMITLEYKEYKNEPAIYEENEAKLILEKNLSKYIQEFEKKGVQILDNNVKIVKENNKLKAFGQINVIEKIGINVKINQNERRKKYEDEFIREDGSNTE